MFEEPNPMTDVSPPGQTPADASSRPIIVTNRPKVQQDPMFAASIAKGTMGTKPEMPPSAEALTADKPAEKTDDEKTTPFVHEQGFAVHVRSSGSGHLLRKTFTALGVMCLIAAAVFLALHFKR